MSNRTIQTAVVGVTGYAGAELARLMFPRFDTSGEVTKIATGISASPGAQRSPVTIASSATVPIAEPDSSKPCGLGCPRISSGRTASSPPGISTPASSAPRLRPRAI